MKELEQERKKERGNRGNVGKMERRGEREIMKGHRKERCREKVENLEETGELNSVFFFKVQTNSLRV